jgi:hypothetical protein
MSDGSVPQKLYQLAANFADDLTARVQRIIPTDLRFRALAIGQDSGAYVGVGIFTGIEFMPIPLTINGAHRLNLLIKLHMCWDSGQDFLAVDKSFFHVRVEGKDDTPLFRLEYVRQATKDVPCSHLQIHAHRDELTYLLMLADKARPATRVRRDKVPRVAEFHFPNGGHRFRPCIEDVLHSLIIEFGVDKQSGWRAAVEEGREAWRHTQLRAAVRDAPEEAAVALELLGYSVKPPVDGHATTRRERLRAY